MTTRRTTLCLYLGLVLVTPTFAAFLSLTRPYQQRSTTTRGSAKSEAEVLLERARKMRAEIAKLEGDTKTRNSQEQQQQQEQQIISKAAAERLEQKQAKNQRISDGRFLKVPETFEDQIRQAATAVEQAFQDGVTRQIVRFALIPQDEVLNKDRQWPGGAQQMYRQAAGPLTRGLLSQVNAPTGELKLNEFTKKPTVKSQDIWDFDGSALVTAEAEAGPKGDVQALVLPNTDNKYTNDIETISKAMGDRLFILANPFWRNIESWGINLLAPGAKQRAQDVIFDGGFQETYSLLQKSVRGEDCIALKCYPYDWQLYGMYRQHVCNNPLFCTIQHFNMIFSYSVH
jgi:hypothetical protein